MEEMHTVLENKGFKKQYKKPTFHPLHTEHNECTAKFECCTDLFLNAMDQDIISNLLDAKNRGKDTVTFKIKWRKMSILS